MAETLQQDPSLSQISMGAGIDLGNPMLNMVAQMLLGRYMTPRPIPGSSQSIYDASLQRERSMEFMQLSQAGLFNNAASRLLGGVNQSGWGAQATFMGQMFTGGYANGVFSQLAAPFVGGNPVLAQQRLYANLNPMTMGMLNGQSWFASANQATQAYQGIESRFYRGKDNDIIDYATTRGMRIEDVAQSLTQAAGMGLTGRLGGGGMKGLASGFTKSGLGAIDAARTVLGGNSMDEVMGNLNKFIGSNSFDLTNESSSKELENLLRDVKSAARVAGTTVETIKAIIEEGNKIASSSPNLRSLGGADIARMTTDAVVGGSALARTMGTHGGASLLRMRGGTSGVVQSSLEAQLQSANEPITKGLAALRAVYGENDKQLNDYISNGHVSPWGYRTFLNDFAAKHNTSIFGINSITQSTELASRGMLMGKPGAEGESQRKALQEVGARSAAQQYMEELDAATGGRIKESFLANLGESGDITSALTKSLAGTPDAGLASIFADKGMTVNNALGVKSILEFSGVKDSKFQKSFAAQTAAIKAQTEAEAEMSKAYGHLNAPVTEVMLQQILNGEVKSSGISALAKAWGVDENNSAISSTLRNIKQGNLQSVIGATSADLDSINAAGDAGLSVSDINDPDKSNAAQEKLKKGGSGQTVESVRDAIGRTKSLRGYTGSLDKKTLMSQIGTRAFMDQLIGQADSVLDTRLSTLAKESGMTNTSGAAITSSDLRRSVAAWQNADEAGKAKIEEIASGKGADDVRRQTVHNTLVGAQSAIESRNKNVAGFEEMKKKDEAQAKLQQLITEALSFFGDNGIKRLIKDLTGAITSAAGGN